MGRPDSYRVGDLKMPENKLKFSRVILLEKLKIDLEMK
jgi:hypothetical protein